MMIGCSAIDNTSRRQTPMVRTDLENAENAFSRDEYSEALSLYKKVLENTPQSADQALFYIGVIQASPRYNERDYQKALNAFQKLLKDYPASRYQPEVERTIPLLKEILNRDKRVKALLKQVETLETQIEQMKKIDLDVEEKRRKVLENK